MNSIVSSGVSGIVKTNDNCVKELEIVRTSHHTREVLLLISTSQKC
jgi:hypothetical protein